MRDDDTTISQWWHQLDLDQQYQQEQAMKVSQMIESKYLAKSDFEDQDGVGTIKGVRQDNLAKEGQPEEMRWVLGFREYPKPMVLNITTIRVLEQAFGGDTDQWMGNRVNIFVDPNVSFGGKVVGGLRLRPVKNTIPKGAVSHAQPAPEDFNDEVPF